MRDCSEKERRHRQESVKKIPRTGRELVEKFGEETVKNWSRNRPRSRGAAFQAHSVEGDRHNLLANAADLDELGVRADRDLVDDDQAHGEVAPLCDVAAQGLRGVV